MSSIYLDGAASTALDPRVVERLRDAAGECPGNAAAVHPAGVAAARQVERARAIVAARLGCDVDEVLFCSGGTEANNTALLGTAWQAGEGHLVLSAIEHASVLQPARWLAERGFELTLLPVDSGGRVDPAAVATAVREDTILVSVMHANNETGAVQPIAEVGAFCRERGIRFHVDACQSLGKLPVRPGEIAADLVTLNAHKLHGPHGVGALFVRDGVPLVPLLHGGGHERGLRAGTANTEGISGFAHALELADEEDATRLAGLREYLRTRLFELLPQSVLVGGSGPMLPSILNVRFPGCSGTEIARGLGRRGISVGTGSACREGEDAPSHVLLAMGLNAAEAREAVRFGLHRFVNESDLDRVVQELTNIVREIR